MHAGTPPAEAADGNSVVLLGKLALGHAELDLEDN